MQNQLPPGHHQPQSCSMAITLKHAFVFLMATSATSTTDPFNVHWSEPSQGPGRTLGNALTYMDAMPLGNGRVTALAWANTSIGGCGIYLGSQEAMSSQTELFKLAHIQLSISPNPYVTADAHFNQTLDLSTGTVMIKMGEVGINVWVDANADTLYIDINAPSVVSIEVTSSSTRPNTPWVHSDGGTCGVCKSMPDVYVDPLPVRPYKLRRAQPNPWPFRHASGDQRPLRTLQSIPKLVEFQSGSVISYHRNNVSEGDNLGDIFKAQGIEALVATTPDWWIDRQSGFVLDAAPDAAPLRRENAHTLTSVAPNTTFAVRATVLAVQTATSEEWMHDIAALVATSKPRAVARSDHELFWAAFWSRSHINVNQTSWPKPMPPSPPPPPPPSPSPAKALPVPGASLWLRASSLTATHSHGAAVSVWGEPGRPGVTQLKPQLQPTFVGDAFGPGAPGVRFSGAGTFLENASLTLPGQGSTHFAVFRDTGSTAPCCSGVIFWSGGDLGISTTPADPQSHAIWALADGPGVSTTSHMDVYNLTVAAQATYAAGGSAAVAFEVGHCAVNNTYKNPSARAVGVMIGSRNNELARYFKGVVAEVIVYPRQLTVEEADKVRAYLVTQHPSTAVSSSKVACGANKGFQVSQMYAITRYTQAVQSRNTIWPIKFNGMAFVAAMGSNGEADRRQWGACNWWQNTRLPYGAMLAAGDFDTFQVLLEYKLNQEVLLSQRTQLYWNHSGMWTTETSHLSGAYRMVDYGCKREPNYPAAYEQSGYLHVDQGGDSGGPEYALMALDYLLWSSTHPATPTRAAREYLRLAFQNAEYYMHHFTNHSEDGRVLVWPAQVLETYWCTFNTTRQTWENCCENDSPTISGMMTLFEKLLSLPPGLATPAQVQSWTHFRDELMPRLPVTGSANASVIAPAQVISSGKHNGEGPELYAVHPHRVFTKGKEVATGADISLGQRTVANSSWGQGGRGWNYGINAHALIGNARGAAAQLLGRYSTPPASGYRFPGFAPHEQDFDPSADHFANANRALQEMLIQSGDDGFAVTTIVLFPAWPCEWDVSFRLWGALRTSVTVEYVSGKLVSLEVEPEERLGAIKWANCVV